MPPDGRRILVVDDDARIADLLVMLLAGVGYMSVVTALTAADAVRLASEQRPDLVILDLTLPDMNSDELFDAITKAAPEARVLVMSGDPLRAQEIRERGAVGLLMKPFKAEALTETVRDALG